MINADIAKKFPQGYWETSGKYFINKHDALVHGTNNNEKVYFKFFNETWDNFNRDLIGKFSLKELYKQRAQQLRDSYDYIILYFSGGADSYNVLRSFIDNNIKLDEVCVKWCNVTLESNTTVYVPNTIDNTSYNYLSEWDLAIAPVLKEISISNPEIKIEIVDWFKNRFDIGSADIFRLVNHWHDVEVPSLAVWSPNEQKLVEKGKKVASLYGIDKPNIFFDTKGNASMFFIDGATTMGTPNPCNIYGTEYFYFAPSFPLITFETASVVANAIKADPDLYKIKYDNEVLIDKWKFIDRWQLQQKKLRHILYDNWTDRFQVFKPLMVDRSDKHFWLFKYDEFQKPVLDYADMSKLHTDQLSPDFLTTHRGNLGTVMYKWIPTKAFPLD